MTRTYDLVLVWRLNNRAWIDQCFRFFAGLGPLWRRECAGEPGCLFRFAHTGADTDSLPRRLPAGAQLRVAGFASHDLVITVSSVRRDLCEMLTAYEVANRIGASHAPYAATGIMGSQCHSAFLVRRVAHLTDPAVVPLIANDVVRPELDRVHAAQEQQYERWGYATAAEPVVFFRDDPADVYHVDGSYFARDPQPRPRGVHSSPVATARHRTTRVPTKPLITQLLQARPGWLTPELTASATQLRLFVNIMQDKGSAASKVHLGDPTRPGTACVTLPIYVPMTDAADGELVARLQRVARFAAEAETRLRRRCGTCRRTSVTTPACRTTRSTARTRPVLLGARADAGAPAGPAASPPRRPWSCGRCPGARFEEETIFICPCCGGFVSPLEAMNACPGCGLTLD